MLKVQRIGQLVSPAEVSEHTESSPSQVVNDLSVFFPRLEIPNRFQKGSVKLTFFGEGQLEPETAQPEPEISVNNEKGRWSGVGKGLQQLLPVLRSPGPGRQRPSEG